MHKLLDDFNDQSQQEEDGLLDGHHGQDLSGKFKQIREEIQNRDEDQSQDASQLDDGQMGQIQGIQGANHQISMAGESAVESQGFEDGESGVGG